MLSAIWCQGYLRCIEASCPPPSPQSTRITSDVSMDSLNCKPARYLEAQASGLDYKKASFNLETRNL